MSNRSAFVLTVLLATTITSGASEMAPTAFEMAPGSVAREGIVLRLIHAGGHAATVVVSNAGTAAVTMAPLPTLRIRPVPDHGVLRLEASIEAEDPATAPSWTMTGPILPGGTVHLDVGGYVLDVEWLGTASLADTPFFGREGDSESECCLVCDGIKTCACRVRGSCGTCCTEACGPCAATAAM